ncbi:MFS transporter [Marisediminicola sp. LYQ134]|uniref:MFS transporter n=1 Tax=Marisediminicola sp. LYQ134 TaxID=3391061 RepID=UPI0039832A7C
MSDRTRWQVFAVCVGVAALTILDLSKVNVGLPSIEESLGAGPSELQIIVAGYALAFGLALVPAGRLGDIHSRKVMFVIGLTLFTVSSILCALAPNITFLLIARVLQGVAAGIQMPQVLGLLQQMFQGAERGRAFGVFGATIGISTALGPTLGGLLIAIGGPTDGWRLLFWMNVPLGVIALFFAIRLLPKHVRSADARTELDLVGIVLLGIATLSLMLPFVLTTGGPDDDPRRWAFLALFVVALAAFVWWERRYQRNGKSPVVRFSLFRDSSYRNGLLVATAYFGALPALFLLSTLYLQQGLGLEPVYAGMVSITFALASAVTSWLGGRLVEKYGRLLVVAGLVSVIIGFALVGVAAVYLPPELSPWYMAAAMTVAGAGGGFVISPNQTLTLARVPVAEGGVAGSMAQVGQRVGTAVGVAAASSTFFATLYRETGQLAAIEVYHDGFRNGLLVSLGLVVVALVFALLDLRKRRLESAETQATPGAPDSDPAAA